MSDFSEYALRREFTYVIRPQRQYHFSWFGNRSEYYPPLLKSEPAGIPMTLVEKRSKGIREKRLRTRAQSFLTYFSAGSCII